MSSIYSNIEYLVKKNEYDNKQSNSKALEDNVCQEKPNFIPSGILMQYGKTLSKFKFVFPAEITSPDDNIILHIFIFKDNSKVASICLTHKKYFLFGTDENLCSYILKNKTCSRQHAVILFRKIYNNNKKNSKINESIIKPYIQDINSANGTYLNNIRLLSNNYYELLDNDILNFGKSNKDYVVKIEYTC